ncbi:hypothetical protein B1987_22730 [Mycobacterium kansasii]|nr:hypothetical protein B1987_22730 [Mycobacterium kansasii]
MRIDSSADQTALTERIAELEKVKSAAAWQVTTSDGNHTHTAEFTTPTGKRYRSGAPPRRAPITVSDVEVRIGIALARHAA